MGLSNGTLTRVRQPADMGGTRPLLFGNNDVAGLRIKMKLSVLQPALANPLWPKQSGCLWNVVGRNAILEKAFARFSNGRICVPGAAGSQYSISILNQSEHPVIPTDWRLRHVSGAESMEDL